MLAKQLRWYDVKESGSLLQTKRTRGYIADSEDSRAINHSRSEIWRKGAFTPGAPNGIDRA